MTARKDGAAMDVVSIEFDLESVFAFDIRLDIIGRETPAQFDHHLALANQGDAFEIQRDGSVPSF
eukprot:CAMPEP_0172465362 /NCGR_PEP_ID=MMETSP1065-20121228/53279_1 /TAXON_ID=265537 /ORGANISM="Amphiprora paludosa, Strain CCMP125" /LENGTH=64 /DNA_ID=CAMNT_0013221869 /DNA_START=158 /DNA_END=352 /DNA_ORIENTATION=+